MARLGTSSREGSLEGEADTCRGDGEREEGLGEMDADPTWDTLLDPARRVLKQITVEDATASENMLELTMGAKVPPRKEWITENRSGVDAGILEG